MRRRPSRPSRLRRAFTLVEAVATITVLGVLGSVTSGIIVQATDGYIEARIRGQLHAEASVALDRIAREIRSIPLDAAASGIAPDIDNCLASYIEWNALGNRISTADGDLLLKKNAGTAQVLMNDVTAFSIAAFDESNTQLGFNLSGATCDPIRRLEFTLTAVREGTTVTLRTRVFLRSTMSGAS